MAASGGPSRPSSTARPRSLGERPGPKSATKSPHFGGFTTAGGWHDRGYSGRRLDAMLKNLFRAMFSQASQPISPAATPGATQARPGATESDHARLRAPPREVDLVLSSVAEAWLMALPRSLRPAALCSSYPRVANRLALCWNDAALTDRLLDDLLIGRRERRKGFPGPVAEELLRLRRFHDHHRYVQVQESVWEFRTLAPSDR